MATTSDIPAYGYMEQFPALTYHYGLSFGELVSMPFVFLELYVKTLPELQAKEQMQRIEAATYPHAKPDAQKKLFRSLEREANRSTERTRAAATSKSPVIMQRQLGGIGIGVRFVDKRGEVNDA